MGLGLGLGLGLRLGLGLGLGSSLPSAWKTKVCLFCHRHLPPRASVRVAAARSGSPARSLRHALVLRARAIGLGLGLGLGSGFGVGSA